MDAATSSSVSRVLVERNFWPFFIGNLLSNSGTWFQNIAQVLLVYRLTGSPFLVGVVNFSQFAAVIFLAPVAGNAADRYDRRRLVIVNQVCAAALAGLLAVLTAVGEPSPALVISVALAMGVTLALSTPALQAIVPSLVTRDQLPAAIALNAITYNLSRALGPVAGVFVIARWGIPTAFAINALSFLVLAGALVRVSPAPQQIQTAGRIRLRDSMRAVRADRLLLAPLIVVGLVSLTADPVNTLTPAFATEVYGRADTFTGFLVGSFGAGAVVAALLVTGRWKPSYELITVTLGLLALGMGLFAVSGTEVIGLTGLFIGGFGFLSSISAATSLLHLEVSDTERGRVMALWSLSFHGSRPIGSLVDGAIASLVSIRLAGLAMVVPALAGCLGLTALIVRRRRGVPNGDGSLSGRDRRDDR
ncbi:MAG: MFS transporter [Actinomycetota bacterium]